MYSSVVSNQPRITAYFPILDELQKQINDNKDLREKLKYFLEHNFNEQINVDNNDNFKPFLKKLHESAIVNSNRKKSGNRYDNALKLFATYLYTIGGRMLYETLYANLPLPSLTTVSRTINKYNYFIREGQCRAKELKEFLISRNLPLVVWLSEDATRLTGRVQYDKETNQLIGFVLPFDSNGMPIANTCSATSVNKMEESFNNGTIAKLIYVVIAQSLVERGPPFSLCLFGTDNKFTYIDVARFQSSNGDKKCLSNSPLPDCNNIIKVLDKAKEDAFLEITCVGMEIDITACENILIESNDVNVAEDIDDTDIDNDLLISPDESSMNSCDISQNIDDTSDQNENNDLVKDLNILSNVTGTLELKNYEKNKTELSPTSEFVLVRDKMNKESIVRKSSICWLLSQNDFNLSSDRLQRVRDCELNKSKKDKCKNNNTNQKVFKKKCDEIAVGDWCLFQRLDCKKCYLGHVLSFG